MRLIYVFCVTLAFSVTTINLIAAGELDGVLQWTERDEPVQLVRPDAKHKQLVVVEENLQLLRGIRGSVATVAVVGKFHSGKSFLMNQLMRKSAGFGIGPTVKPQTMGIWMWGKPLTIPLSQSGETLSVVFLDTEGFAANNISEHYDAKIFAVATLLSSYLIYNSVKIIDQSDIDYLEILARRTQLFALRSQLSKSEWTSDFNQDLLSFPPLLWVVQDFVQTTDGFTASEWLAQLMDSHSRENEDYEISLLGIFNHIDCHTLFIPAIKKHLLIDLSKAGEDDLTEDYRAERDKLIAKLFSSLKPKEKNDKPITGPELANLLRVLVTAANEGSLSDVPTRWTAFTRHLQTTATEDCLRFYDAELTAFHNATPQEPLNPNTFKEWHRNASVRAVNLLEHLLYGLSGTSEKSREELVMLMKQKFEKAFEINEKRIKLKCSELHSRLLLSSELKYGELPLPLATSELSRIIVGVTSDVIQSFLLSVKHLLTAEATETHIKNLKSSLKNLGDSMQLKNGRAIEDFLNEAANKAKTKFEELVASEGSEPRLPKMLNELVSTSTQHSISLYNGMSNAFSKETVYQPFIALLKENLSEASKQIHKENEALVNSKGSKVIRELVDYVEDETSSEQMPLPIQNSQLEAKVRSATQQAQLKFRDALDDFSNYVVYAKLKIAFERELELVAERRRKENVEAFTREVSGPLKVAKSVILLSADKYTTEFGLKQFMRKVCLLNLNEGRASGWPFELRLQIVDHFIESEPELRSLLSVRKGWWSTVVGFFQWVLWVTGISDER